jgi:hypothetical protein
MVITFLPYPDIEKSLKTLDKRRLGKQRVEASQIIKALKKETKGWVNHPATRMWEGCEFFLKHYYNESLRVWEEAGGKNKLLSPLTLTEEETQRLERGDKPLWWGWEPLHESHKAALLRKDEEFYKDIISDDSPYLLLGYVWPHKHTSETPFKDLFEPINPRQLLNKCFHEGCRNPEKKNGLCGVHARMKIYQKRFEI